MAITFDVLDQFQENKVFQTAKITNNIPRSSLEGQVQNGRFVTIETVTY